MRPKKAPKLQKMMECHSSLIFMKRMANEAVTMPANTTGSSTDVKDFEKKNNLE